MTTMTRIEMVLFTALASSAGLGCTTPAEPDVAGEIDEVAAALSSVLRDDAARARLVSQLGDGEQPVRLGELSAQLGLEPELAARLTVRAPLGVSGSGERPLVTRIPGAAEPATLAYYRDGELERVLDARTVPEGSVLLVETAEAPETPEADRSSSPQASTATMKEVRLKRIRIQHDSEVGPFNDPEIYMTCAFPNGESVKVYLPNVDDEDHWYDRDKHIVNWYLSYGNPMRCGFFEEDGGSFGTITVTATATLGPVTGQFQYVFPIKNDDDDMGRTILDWNDPSCMNRTTGDVDFRVCW